MIPKDVVKELEEIKEKVKRLWEEADKNNASSAKKLFADSIYQIESAIYYNDDRNAPSWGVHGILLIGGGLEKLEEELGTEKYNQIYAEFVEPYLPLIQRVYKMLKKLEE